MKNKIGVFLILGILVLSVVGFYAWNNFADRENMITGNVIAANSQQNKSIGIDYHAIGPDWGKDAFLVRYHNSSFRNVVLFDLASMKASGIDVVSTRIWMVRNNESSGYLANQYHHHFPLTEQELINLNQYALDVANQNLTLSLTLLGLWCANFEMGSPEGLVGHATCSNDASEYVLRFKSAVNGILNAVKDVRRTDGEKLVDVFYFTGEARIEGWVSETNAKWYYRDSGLWNWFYNTVSQAGITPSMYFQAVPGAVHPMDATIPSSNPLYNHATMESVAGSLKFLKNNNLPIPARIDFDFYVADNSDGSYTPHATIKKILDDFDAVIPSILNKPSVDYYIAETTYRHDDARRYLNQKAWKENLYLRNNFKGVNFWTTPNASGVYSAVWPMNIHLLTNKGNTGLVSSDVGNCVDLSAQLCSVNVSVNYIDAPSKFYILSVINPANSEELFITCKSTSFTSLLPWFQRNINYTFILSTMNSLDTSSTCAAGSALLSKPNRLILDIFNIARPTSLTDVVVTEPVSSEPVSSDCVYTLGGVRYTGEDNVVGLSNGDPKFYCLNGRFYECSWTFTNNDFAYEATHNEVIGNQKCDLVNKRWVGTTGDCSYVLEGVQYTGVNNTVGLNNGDPKFYCLSGRFYECGWALTNNNFAHEAANNFVINNHRCDLSSGGAWVL